MQNLRENSFEIKQNLNWSKMQNKLTDGQGGMIIQLRAAIFERIKNVQIQALQTVFIFCLLSLPFLCVFHLWFKCCRHHIVYNEVMRHSVTCSLILHHVTENRYVKCPVHFFRWNIFLSLGYEQNFLTNRIGGKLMKIKKMKLYINAYHVMAQNGKHQFTHFLSSEIKNKNDQCVYGSEWTHSHEHTVFEETSAYKLWPVIIPQLWICICTFICNLALLTWTNKADQLRWDI